MDNHPSYKIVWDDYKRGKINIKRYISDILRKKDISISKDGMAEVTSRVYDMIYDDITNISEMIVEDGRKRIREEDIINYYSKFII